MTVEQLVRQAGQMIKRNSPSFITNKVGKTNYVAEWDLEIQKYWY